jgi:hypothetical protein
MREEEEPYNQEIRKKVRLPMRSDLLRLREEYSRSDNLNSKEELKSIGEEDGAPHLNGMIEEIFANPPLRKVLATKNNNQLTFKQSLTNINSMDLDEGEVTLKAYGEKYATVTNFKTITNVPDLHHST